MPLDPIYDLQPSNFSHIYFYISEHFEPTCVTQTLKILKQWKIMSDEFNALVQYGIYSFLLVYEAQNIFRRKWVFHLKQRLGASPLLATMLD